MLLFIMKCECKIITFIEVLVVNLVIVVTRPPIALDEAMRGCIHSMLILKPSINANK